MDLIFVLLTQLDNLLNSSDVGFEAVDKSGRIVGKFRPFLPKVKAGETGYAEVSRVRRRVKQWAPGWKIRVLLDGERTGIELDPIDVTESVRIIFRLDSDVLRVSKVPEIVGFKDMVLRHRYFGCMRNYSWNGRDPILIARSDSKEATESRNRKGHCQRLAPFVAMQESGSSSLNGSLGTNNQNPPTVEETQESEEAVKQMSARNLQPSPQPLETRNLMRRETMRSHRQALQAPKCSSSGMATSKLAWLKVETEPPSPQVRPRDVPQPPKPRSRMATLQQAKLRDGEPPSPQVRPRDVPQSPKQCSCMATLQQAKLRDDEPPSPQVRPRDVSQSPKQCSCMATLQQAKLRDDDEPPSPQVRPRDVPQPPKPCSRMATLQQAKLRDDDEPPSPHVRPRNVPQPPKPCSRMATLQQAKLRDGEPPSPQVRPRDVPHSPKQCSCIATLQQAKLRDDEPPSPQVRPRDVSQSPKQCSCMATLQQAKLRDGEPPSPQVRPRDVPLSLQPCSCITTLQQAKLKDNETLSPQVGTTGERAVLSRGDELSTGPLSPRVSLQRDEGEMDGFVCGILLVFALTVCLLLISIVVLSCSFLLGCIFVFSSLY